MLAFVVVKAEPGANPSLGLGNVLIGIEVDFLVFEAAPQPLDEDVVHVAAPCFRRGRLLPSMLIMTPCCFRVPVKSSLVNWLPWSVLKISGRPLRESASSSASTQKSASSVLESRQARTARLAQSLITTRERKHLAIGM